MNDLIDHLAEHRPTDNELDTMWPAERRVAMLGRLGHAKKQGNGRRRKMLLVAAALLVAVPATHEVLAPDAAQARADLLALAAAAGGPVLAPGQYLHLTSESVQDNRWPYQGGANWVNDRQTWLRWDGALYVVETRPGEQWTDYGSFPPPTKPSLQDPTPEFAATLPTDAASFRAYIEPRVSGSNSHDEALFVAVTDLIRSDTLPPANLAAALGALADVDGVRTDAVTVSGHQAIRISYRRFGIALLGEHSLTVDRATARPIQDASVDPLGTYVSTTTSAEAVDALPATLQAVFNRHPRGARLCADGRPPAAEDC